MTVNFAIRENRFRHSRATTTTERSFISEPFPSPSLLRSRVSYLVLPEKLLRCYKERGTVFSSTVSRVDQRIVAGFLKEGYYERHLNKMRAVYKNRHDVLLEGLKEIPGIEISGENAGVHLLVCFQNGRTEGEPAPWQKGGDPGLWPVRLLRQRKRRDPYGDLRLCESQRGSHTGGRGAFERCVERIKKSRSTDF